MARLTLGAVCVGLLCASPRLAFADDGATLYRQLCATCHDGANERAPSRDALRAMAPERVLTALQGGVMVAMASSRTPAEHRAIAEFVTGKSFAQALTTTPPPQAMCASVAGAFSALDGPRWNTWGGNNANTRFQDGAMAGLTSDQVPSLKVKWAFGFPGEVNADSQPTIAGGRVFVGSPSGLVYSLSAATGCIHWHFQAAAAVRAAVTIGRINTGSASRDVAFIDDRAANVYAVDAATGTLMWSVKVDSNPLARATASPTFHDGRLYIGVASGEEGAGAPPDYECCRFRGSLVVLDAATGKQIWKTYTIAEDAKPMRKNKVGTQLWGPSGAPIWTSPTIDVTRNAVYVTTGDNYSDPPTTTSDAFMAFDLTSGKILWSRQMTTSDAWNVACRLPDKTNCPDSNGPDFDFASPPILVTLANGRRALVAGQKSGVVHAIDPDREGAILWQTRVGKGGTQGGVQWGAAVDRTNVYVALSDLARTPIPGSTALDPDPTQGGGMFALSFDTGQRVWYTPPPGCGEKTRCSPAQSAAVSAIPGVVFSGSVDGHLRGYATESGAIVWDIDTARPYETVNKVPARGGSLNVGGPAIGGGLLIVSSGYVNTAMPGNVLLVFSVDGK